MTNEAMDSLRVEMHVITFNGTDLVRGRTGLVMGRTDPVGAELA